jgi:protein-disulfide isomerase
MSGFKNFKSLPKKTKTLLSLGLIFGLLVALPLFIWSISNMKFDVRKRAQTPSNQIDITNRPFIGLADAPVTIVEYSDFQCPFCKSFVDNTMSTILANYPNEVKIVFKNFPLTGTHPLAEKAAIAAECAFAQDKFWEMHDLIFVNQDTLAEENFASFSAQLNLDQTAFNECYTNQTPLDQINADILEGQNLGITGTPTFFIARSYDLSSNTKIEGALPFESFQTAIEEALLPTPSPSPTDSPSPSPTESASSSPTASATSTATATATATSVATATATASPTNAPAEGEPNSCGGTCGSNYNCKANLYCYQGFCRNPICSSDTDCDCSTTSATVAPTKKPVSYITSKVTPKPLSKSTSKSSSRPSSTYVPGVITLGSSEPMSRVPEEEATAPENMFFAKYAVYLFAGFIVIVVSTIFFAIKKKHDSSIPHIMPPTNI